MRDIKIQQQTEPESTKLEISEQRSAMHGQNRRDRLKFDYDKSADEEIDPVAILNRQLFVADWNGDLALHANALFFELVYQAHFIRALQQPGTNGRMHLHCRPDDCVPDILLDHLRVLCVSIASFALPNLHLLFAASCFATSAGRWGHQPSGAGGILTRRCTSSGSIAPFGRIGSSTSTIVTRAAIAISGLKLRCERRNRRLPTSSAW